MMNLLSTKILDDEGYVSYFAQGVPKLVRGSLIVVVGKKYWSMLD